MKFIGVDAFVQCECVRYCDEEEEEDYNQAKTLAFGLVVKVKCAYDGCMS